MKITGTLSRYLAKTYLFNMVILLVGLLSLVYLFDTVELLRRASKKTDIPLSLVLKMGALKLPEVGQIIFPFAILFSGIFTFWQLTHRYELIVMRAAGFSVWQFLAPIIGVAIMVGFLQMAIINPVGALFMSKFEQLEKTHLIRQSNQIALFREGLWLRQNLLPVEGAQEEGYVILYAKKITQPDWVLQDLMVLYFDSDNHFIKRVNAKTARLKPERWVFEDVMIHEQQEPPRNEGFYTLPTILTIPDIEESFSSPATMSFWRLPAHIQTLEDTGFDASRLRIHYQNLLAQPLLFAAMILLAAAVSMRPPRSSGTFGMVFVGVFTGFFIFFMSSFLQALGASQQIPVLLAAWSPAVISLLVGLSIMMKLEDG